MAINFVPILVAGGVFAYASHKSKNRRRRHRSKTKHEVKEQEALPPAEEKPDNGYGEVYDAREVDVIEAKAGDNFTLNLGSNPSTGYGWNLVASPPDNSIEHIGVEHIQDPEDVGVPGAGGTDMFKFKAAKAGTGSLVFHHQAPWLKGKEPPAEIVEVETKIS